MAKPVNTPKPITVNILKGSAAITKAIDSIARRGKSLDKDLHIAAVSCLAHAIEHGDITLAEKLVGAIPKQSRKNAMRDWFINFGPFAYDSKNKVFTYAKKASYDVAAATVTPFWEFKAEPEYVPFNVDAAIISLVARAEKAIAKGDKVDAVKLATLKKLAA